MLVDVVWRVPSTLGIVIYRAAQAEERHKYWGDKRPRAWAQGSESVFGDTSDTDPSDVSIHHPRGSICNCASDNHPFVFGSGFRRS